MHAGRFAALLVVILVAGLCALAQADPVTAPPAPAAPGAPDSYRLAIGDIVNVVVEGEEAFTRECQVNSSGTISYPKLGDVAAAGLTCEELRTRLDQGLRTYLRHPYVTATVRQYGQTGSNVFVMGEVTRPGPYPLTSGAGFMQALAAAGGPTEAAGANISLLKGRSGQTYTFQVDDLSKPGAAAPGVVLEPGDVLLVLRKEVGRYAVLGEVPKQGMFDMPTRGEVRVLDAIANAGLVASATTLTNASADPTTRFQDLLNNPGRAADLEHAKLTRAGKDVPLDVAALLRGDTSQNLVVQSGDVLTVPRRNMVQVYALGEVHTPGRQVLPAERATVLDLLNASGGLTATARPSEAKLVRMVGGKPSAKPLNLGGLIDKGDMAQNVQLQDGDALFVPPKSNAEPAWRTAVSALSLLVRFPW